MQHMLKHLILPCVFTSKIKVALFYMVYALHLNVAWKWGTLTVSMFFVFLSFVHVFSLYFPNRNSCVVNFPWYFPFGFKILFLFRHLCSWRGFFVVIYDMINDIVNDHLQRSINNVISIPRKIIHPTPPCPVAEHDTTWSSAAEHQQRDQHSTKDNTPHPTLPCRRAWYNVIICSGASTTWSAFHER